MTTVPIPAGSLLTISTGEYSDYSVWGVFKALDEIDADALRSEYLALHPDQAGRYTFNTTEFVAWVSRKGLLEPVPSFEWHLGTFGVDEMSVDGP